MLTLTIHRNFVRQSYSVGSGAEMNWAKCVWEEKFLAPTPLIKIIVTGVVHWTILSLAIQGENSHPRQVVNPLFNSMLVDQPTQVAIFVVYTSSS